MDFEDGLIHVRCQLSRADSNRLARLVPLKTGAGERDVFVLPELAKLLRRHKLASGHSLETDYVFATREGKPRSQW